MTTTTNLNLTLPTVGADSDAWGNELNTNWTTADAHMAGLLYGLALSAAGSTATFGIAAGTASGMVLASAYTKTTSAWGVGTAQGALDTGAVANSTWYHVYLIQRPDTAVVDILVSTSPSAPTMPTNYTRKRRIGSMKTDGSAQWVKFSQNGDEFLWDVPVLDANNVTPANTSAASVTLTSPTGVKVNTIGAFFLTYNGGASYANLSSLDISDIAPSPSNGNTSNVTSAAQQDTVPFNIRSNTSAQIRARFSATTCTYYIYTYGWNDRRGRD